MPSLQAQNKHYNFLSSTNLEGPTFNFALVSRLERQSKGPLIIAFGFDIN
jgi:hypothetical protein